MGVGGHDVVSEPGVVCKGTMQTHKEPLNCGQLLITSLPFATAVWEARPARFVNGELSQQHYANVVKLNFTHDGLPLEFYNQCWMKGVHIKSHCRLVSMHATCVNSAGDKRTLMSVS